MNNGTILAMESVDTYAQPLVAAFGLVAGGMAALDKKIFGAVVTATATVALVSTRASPSMTLKLTDAVLTTCCVLCIAVHAQMHRTCLGVTRVVWVVAIAGVTTTYTIVPDTSPAFFTIRVISVTLIGTIALLLVCMSVCKRNHVHPHNRSIAEAFIIGGAFCLRFAADINETLHFNLGRMLWLASLWLSTITVVTIRSPPIVSPTSSPDPSVSNYPTSIRT